MQRHGIHGELDITVSHVYLPSDVLVQVARAAAGGGGCARGGSRDDVGGAGLGGGIHIQPGDCTAGAGGPQCYCRLAS